MSTTVMILLVLLVIYVPLWFIVWKHPSALRHGFQKYGPTIKINSRFGLRFIERYGRYKRFWRVMGNIAQAIAFVLMVMMIFIMVVAVINLPNTMSRGGVGIEYALALPGLNPMLPLWFGLLGLIIAMVCHEMAHGLQSRANDIGVKHTGVLYAVVPLGAFVEPDQEDVEKAPRRAKLDLYTAGIATNFVLAAVAFLIFSTAMMGTIHSPYEDDCAVYAVADEDLGIPAGAIIDTINGDSFHYTEDYYTSPTTSWVPGDVVSVHYLTETGEGTATIPWAVYVNDVVKDSPADDAGLKNTWVSSIVLDGQAYYFYTAAGFTSFMKTTHGGDNVTVNYVALEGDTYVPHTVDLVLDRNNGIGYFGIYSTTAGMSIITTDMVLEMGSNPLYGAKGLMDYPTALLSFIARPLSGFDPIPQSVEWWYGEQFDGYWIVCTAFYWIFWLNIMLGITNALPAMPFDGGFVFMGWVDTILEKRGMKDRKAREEKAYAIAKNVSSLMLFLYMLVILAAIF